MPIPKPLCDYGCGKEGRFTVGKRLCCSPSQNSCQAVKKRISDGNRTAWQNPEVRDRNVLGLQKTEEWKRKISKTIKDLYDNGYKHPRLGKHWTDEQKILISIKTREKAPRGEEHPLWEGGGDMYWHNMAWGMFGKDHCSMCGLSNEDNISQSNMRLSMHCLSDRYDVLESGNWETVCNGCHNIIHEKPERMRRARYASA